MAAPAPGRRDLPKRIAETMAGEAIRQAAEFPDHEFVPPSVFRVYLHPDDWMQWNPLEERIRKTCKELLDKTVAEKNRAQGFFSRKKYEPAGPWEVELLEDHDDDAVRDQPRIFPEFPELPRQSRGGRATVPVRTEAGVAGRAILARFEFEDERGPRSFEMTASPVVIGRQEEGRWLDIEIVTNIQQISRRHAEVRRTDSGAFEVQDLSRCGTWLNGAQLPPGEWRPLPDESALRLADALEIRFRAERG